MKDVADFFVFIPDNYFYCSVAFSKIDIDCSLLLVFNSSTIDLGIVLLGSHRDESSEMLADRFEVDMRGGKRGSLGEAHIGRGLT